MVKTAPTLGPMFGSFKMQIDVFKTPIRLYSALLHNNRTQIGRKMSEVLYPTLLITPNDPDFRRKRPEQAQVSPSSLMAYLGIRSFGYWNGVGAEPAFSRAFNAIPMAIYYDIYKNYYANKQEEVGYILSGRPIAEKPIVKSVILWLPSKNGRRSRTIEITGEPKILNLQTLQSAVAMEAVGSGFYDITDVVIYNGTSDIPLDSFVSGNSKVSITQTSIRIENPNLGNINGVEPLHATANTDLLGLRPFSSNGIEMVEFPLENIDEFREAVLASGFKGLVIADVAPSADGYNSFNKAPYVNNIKKVTSSVSQLMCSMDGNGLAVKTYLSDRFNNWLNSEWIEGEGGVTDTSAIDVSAGILTMDALNLAQKVYNYLNRIVVSDGSYHAWKEATYGMKLRRMAETPIYMGGMSTEIVFNEVVSTADTQTGDGITQLGAIASTGRNGKKKGGRSIRIHANDEDCYITIIASITPRVDYSQGNDWFAEITNNDQLHKPAFDAIGFQDLTTEEMAACTTGRSGGVTEYKAIGKQPAWIHYMTRVNQNYGSFAKPDEQMFMVLDRDYEIDSGLKAIKDATTYIDPSKFNNVFATTNITAQNFWVQVAIRMTARRVMSAKVMPTL